MSVPTVHATLLLLVVFASAVSTFASSPPQGKLRFAEMVDTSGVTYRNVSGDAEKRFIHGSLGSGAGLIDYDQDGDLDLYLVNGAGLDDTRIVEAGPNRLYRNEGNWFFRDVTEEAGVGHTGWGVGCTVGDYDNDGLSDLYVTNIGANVLFRNQGDGTFRSASSEAGVGHPGWGTSSTFFDADRDGNLDLYVANYVDPDLSKLPLPGTGPTCRWFQLDVFCGPKGLIGAADLFYRNRGDGSFADATREAGLFDSKGAYGLGVVTLDYDGDGDTDLYIANDSVPNFLLRNDGHGRFQEVGLLAGAAYNASGSPKAGMGVDVADLDASGLPDIFVTNFANETNTLYANERSGIFVDLTSETNLEMASLPLLGWATRFVDLDNDGDEDLFVANGHVFRQIEGAGEGVEYRQRNQVFLNQGEREFVENVFATGDAMEQEASSRGGAFGDIDNDGDADAVIINIDDVPSLLRNETRGQGHWIALHLVGTTSNRDGIGARVVLTNGTRRQTKEVHPSGSFLSSNDPRVYFGMGEFARTDEIHIIWPSGDEQRIHGARAGQILLVVEGRGDAVRPLRP